MMPFRAEPLTEWTKEGDLFRFLDRLCDTTGKMIEPDGATRSVSYRDYANSLYETGKIGLEATASRFYSEARSAKPAAAAAVAAIIPPDFRRDAAFGLAAKAFIAWDGIVDTVLSDGAFYSLTHLLEASSEIECSIFLAEKLFYKQAIQVLRNYVEELVLPLYFCAKPEEFELWKVGDYRIPFMRRPKIGMLDQLQDLGVISTAVAREVSNLYGELNGAVHAKAESMLHRGIETREYRGHVFKYEDFRLWTEFLARTVKVGTELLRINIQQWEASMGPGKLYCDLCKGETLDPVDPEPDASGYQTLRCRRCGRTLLYRVGPPRATES